VANYAFRTSGNGTGWEAYFARDGWKGAWNQGQVKKDVWLYMTATYDAKDTIKIYENGVEIGSVGGMGKPGPKNDTEVNIGGWTNNTFARDGWKGAWNQGQVKKDVWLYMTATYDAKDTIKIYENAEEIASVGGMGKPAPQNDTDTNIGGWTNNTSETLDGILYEVAIFASVLEAADIKELMEEGMKTLLPVEPSGKLATTWGNIKSRQ
jgi:hypothetical protein